MARRRRSGRAPYNHKPYAEGLPRGNLQSEHCVLMELLSADGQSNSVTIGARSVAIRMMKGSVWQCTCDPAGCRVIQFALEVANLGHATELINELHGNVLESIRSPHANYVLQKVIEVMPRERFDFIAKELSGFGADAARHRYGCRVMCRLIEHSDSDLPLIEEILMDVGPLCVHKYAHHVVFSILEHGGEEERRQITCSLHRHLQHHIANRNFCFLLVGVLTYCRGAEARALFSDLLASERQLLALSSLGRVVLDALHKQGHRI